MVRTRTGSRWSSHAHIAWLREPGVGELVLRGPVDAPVWDVEGLPDGKHRRRHSGRRGPIANGSPSKLPSALQASCLASVIRVFHRKMAP